MQDNHSYVRQILLIRHAQLGILPQVHRCRRCDPCSPKFERNHGYAWVEDTCVSMYVNKLRCYDPSSLFNSSEVECTTSKVTFVNKTNWTPLPASWFRGHRFRDPATETHNNQMSLFMDERHLVIWEAPSMEGIFGSYHSFSQE